jgi:hypothetical protein
LGNRLTPLLLITTAVFLVFTTFARLLAACEKVGAANISRPNTLMTQTQARVLPFQSQKIDE